MQQSPIKVTRILIDHRKPVFRNTNTIKAFKLIDGVRTLGMFNNHSNNRK